VIISKALVRGETENFNQEHYNQRDYKKLKGLKKENLRDRMMRNKLKMSEIMTTCRQNIIIYNSLDGKASCEL
jgi:hypothetical protein